METYQKIMNERLKAYYGTDVSCSHSRFRLAWSTDLTEKRLVPSGVGEELVAETRPKYNYFTDRWILERHHPTMEVGQEVVGADHYEIVWAFTIHGGQYFKPSFENVKRVIDAFLHQMHHPTKLTDKQLADEAERKKLAEEEKIFDVIQQGRSFLGQQLKEGEAVSFANVKRFDS
jgi:hypothetical protein